MTRNRLPIHEKVVRVPLHPIIQQQHHEIALSMDFYLLMANFFHAKSHKLNFISTQSCTSRYIGSIIVGLTIVQHKYSGRGFRISTHHADNEFDRAKIKDI